MDPTAAQDLLDSEELAWGDQPAAVKELVRRLLVGADGEAEFGYAAGVDGTPALPAGALVKSIAFEDGTLTIDDGDAITGDAAFEVPGRLVEPELEFVGTVNYLVLFVVEA